MLEEKKVISLGKKTVTLITTEFDGSIDTDDMLNIDYANILGEILTFPVLVNRIGVLLADMDNHLATERLNIEMFEKDVKKIKAEAEERARKELKKTNNAPTMQQISNEAIKDKELIKIEEEFSKMRYKLLDIQRDRDYINSLYWSSKSKDDKLNKMTDKIRPEEFENEIIDGKINGIMIKVRDKLIQ